MAKRTKMLLTEHAQPLAEQLERLYSLKSILSAGVVVLSKLSPEDREKAVAEANGVAGEKLDIYSDASKQELDEIWANMLRIARKVGVRLAPPQKKKNRSLPQGRKK